MSLNYPAHALWMVTYTSELESGTTSLCNGSSKKFSNNRSKVKQNQTESQKVRINIIVTLKSRAMCPRLSKDDKNSNL